VLQSDQNERKRKVMKHQIAIKANRRIASFCLELKKIESY